MISIRDADAWDLRPVAGVLAANMLPTPLGQWLEPEPILRSGLLFKQFLTEVTAATRRGIGRLIEDRDTVLAAALWTRCCDSDHTVRAFMAKDDFHSKLIQLRTVAEQPHVDEPHYRLTALGAPPGRRDLVSALLADPAPGLPRCMLAEDSAAAELADQCGYQPYGHAVPLASGGVVQPMLRPIPGGVFWVRNQAGNRYGPPATEARAVRRGTP